MAAAPIILPETSAQFHIDYNIDLIEDTSTRKVVNDPGWVTRLKIFKSIETEIAFLQTQINAITTVINAIMAAVFEILAAITLFLAIAGIIQSLIDAFKSGEKSKQDFQKQRYGNDQGKISGEYVRKSPVTSGVPPNVTPSLTPTVTPSATRFRPVNAVAPGWLPTPPVPSGLSNADLNDISTDTDILKNLPDIQDITS